MITELTTLPKKTTFLFILKSIRSTFSRKEETSNKRENINYATA